MTMGEPEFVYDKAEESASSRPIGTVTTYTYSLGVLPARKRKSKLSGKVQENGATDLCLGRVTTFIYDQEYRLMGYVAPDGTFWRASTLGLATDGNGNRQKPQDKIKKNQDSQEGNA